MTELVVHSRSGEPVVRVSTLEDARRYQAILGGEITGGDES